jgi:hypothetical protein
MDDVGGLPAQNATGDLSPELSQQSSSRSDKHSTTGHISPMMYSWLNSSDEPAQEAVTESIHVWIQSQLPAQQEADPQQQAAGAARAAAAAGCLQALAKLMYGNNAAFQVYAGDALKSMVYDDSSTLQALAQEPTCLAALVSLLDSPEIAVVRTALDTHVILAESSCEALHAALFSVPGYLQLLLALLNPNRRRFREGTFRQYSITAAVRVAQLLLHQDRDHITAELLASPNACSSLLCDVLSAKDFGVRWVAKAVRSCLIRIDCHQDIPMALETHYLDAQVAMLKGSVRYAANSSSAHGTSSRSSDSSSKQEAAAVAAAGANAITALRVLSRKEYRSKAAAARELPQFLEKMVLALRINSPAAQVAALDAIRSLVHNRYMDHTIIKDSNSLQHLTPMLFSHDLGYRFLATRVVLMLVEIDPLLRSDITVPPSHSCGWSSCREGICRSIATNAPPELQTLGLKILDLLIGVGDKPTQDRLARTFACIARLLALLHSQNQAMQLAALDLLLRLAHGNDRAAMVITLQPEPLNFADIMWHWKCTGPGVLRSAALESERLIYLNFPKLPPEAPAERATWQDTVSKALCTYTCCAAGPQPCRTASMMQDTAADACDGSSSSSCGNGNDPCSSSTTRSLQRAPWQETVTKAFSTYPCCAAGPQSWCTAAMVADPAAAASDPGCRGSTPESVVGPKQALWRYTVTKALYTYARCAGGPQSCRTASMIQDSAAAACVGSCSNPCSGSGPKAADPPESDPWQDTVTRTLSSYASCCTGQYSPENLTMFAEPEEDASDGSCDDPRTGVAPDFVDRMYYVRTTLKALAERWRRIRDEVRDRLEQKLAGPAEGYQDLTQRMVWVGAVHPSALIGHGAWQARFFEDLQNRLECRAYQGIKGPLKYGL